MSIQKNLPRAILLIGIMFITTLSACGGAPVSSTPQPGNSGSEIATQETPGETIPTPLSTETVSSSTVSFSTDVLPILKDSCIRCHGSSRQSANLMLNTFSNVMSGSEDGPILVPGDAQNSLIVKLVSSGNMPKTGAKLTEAEIQIISDWINAGAPDN